MPVTCSFKTDGMGYCTLAGTAERCAHFPNCAIKLAKKEKETSQIVSIEPGVAFDSKPIQEYMIKSDLA